MPIRNFVSIYITSDLGTFHFKKNIKKNFKMLINKSLINDHLSFNAILKKVIRMISFCHHSGIIWLKKC